MNQKGEQMSARHIVLAVLVAAISLSSVAAAGPATTKQRVAINVKILPQGTFVLTPLRAGALKRDSGTVNGNWRSAPCRDVVRQGQGVMTCTGIWVFTGKRGTLRIREQNEWVDVGNDGNGDGQRDSIAFSTWRVVRGMNKIAYG